MRNVWAWSLIIDSNWLNVCKIEDYFDWNPRFSRKYFRFGNVINIHLWLFLNNNNNQVCFYWSSDFEFFWRWELRSRTLPEVLFRSFFSSSNSSILSFKVVISVIIVWLLTTQVEESGHWIPQDPVGKMLESHRIP